MSIPLLFAKRRFNPRRLFANGEQGVWYDPSDFSTMFQDSAGTTPVTAIEQPVGRILDKSGRGNHASQSTTTSRPILRNLYNLLTYTEQFDNAAWNKINLNVSSDTAATTDPLGGNTADKLVSTGANGSAHQVTTPFVAFGNNVQIVNLNNGTLGSLLSGSFNSFTVTSAGNGWWRISAQKLGYEFSIYAKKGEWEYVSIQMYDNTAGESRVYVYPTQSGSSIGIGDGTSGIYIWGASLVPANEASIPYQRVVTNTLGSGVYDTDVTKFPPYLFFDGTDDWLQTGTINFSSTDKMSVFAGVRKLNQSALNVVAELSATIASNNGTFLLSAPNSAAANYNFSSKGTSQVDNTVTTYSAPITNVVTGLANISAPSNTIRVNGTATTVTTSQGAGNYGSAYSLYIGRRGGTTNPLNGRIYSLLIRGALTSSPQLEQTERWVAAKTGVTL